MAKMKAARTAAKAERAAKAPEPSLDNRRARHEYEKLESLETGLALTGTEIKSIRRGNVSINEAFARLRDNELWLVNLTIPNIRKARFSTTSPIGRGNCSCTGSRSNGWPDAPPKKG